MFANEIKVRKFIANLKLHANVDVINNFYYLLEQYQINKSEQDFFTKLNCLLLQTPTLIQQLNHLLYKQNQLYIPPPLFQSFQHQLKQILFEKPNAIQALYYLNNNEDQICSQEFQHQKIQQICRMFQLDYRGMMKNIKIKNFQNIGKLYFAYLKQSDDEEQKVELNPQHQQYFSKYEAYSDYTRVTPGYISTPLSYPISNGTLFDKELLNNKYCSITIIPENTIGVRYYSKEQINICQQQENLYEFSYTFLILKKSKNLLVKMLEKIFKDRIENNSKLQITNLNCLNYISKQLILFEQLNKKNSMKSFNVLENKDKQIKSILQGNIFENIKNLLRQYHNAILLFNNQIKEAKTSEFKSKMKKLFSVILDNKSYHFKIKQKQLFKNEYMKNQLLKRIGRLKVEPIQLLMCSLEMEESQIEVISKQIQLANRHLKFPCFVMGFENQQSVELAYSALKTCIMNCQSEAKASELINFLQSLLFNLFGMKGAKTYSVTSKIHQINLLKQIIINHSQQIDPTIQRYLIEGYDCYLQQQKNQIFQLHVSQNEGNQGMFFPIAPSHVLYGSNNLYFFFRLFYTLVQRFKKMLDFSNKKQQFLNKLLLFNFLNGNKNGRKKQSQYEGNVDSLFGLQYSPFLKTIHLVIYQLVKKLIAVKSCQVTQFSLTNAMFPEEMALNAIKIYAMTTQVIRLSFYSQLKLACLHQIQTQYESLMNKQLAITENARSKSNADIYLNSPTHKSKKDRSKSDQVVRSTSTLHYIDNTKSELKYIANQSEYLVSRNRIKINVPYLLSKTKKMKEKFK